MGIVYHPTLLVRNSTNILQANVNWCPSVGDFLRHSLTVEDQKNTQTDKALRQGVGRCWQLGGEYRLKGWEKNLEVTNQRILGRIFKGKNKMLNFYF